MKWHCLAFVAGKWIQSSTKSRITVLSPLPGINIELHFQKIPSNSLFSSASLFRRLTTRYVHFQFTEGWYRFATRELHLTRRCSVLCRSFIHGTGSEEISTNPQNLRQHWSVRCEDWGFLNVLCTWEDYFVQQWAAFVIRFVLSVIKYVQLGFFAPMCFNSSVVSSGP